MSASGSTITLEQAKAKAAEAQKLVLMLSSARNPAQAGMSQNNLKRVAIVGNIAKQVIYSETNRVGGVGARQATTALHNVVLVAHANAAAASKAASAAKQKAKAAARENAFA